MEAEELEDMEEEVVYLEKLALLGDDEVGLEMNLVTTNDGNSPPNKH